MHELSIAENIIAICLQNAAGKRVQTVYLEIGALSGVAPEAVDFCFDACSKGTPLAEARLVIQKIPAIGDCTICGGNFPMATIYDHCPRCGSLSITIASGEELLVKELEVAD